MDHSNKKTKKSHYDGCKNQLYFFKIKNKKFVQIGSSIEYGKINSPQKENNHNKQKPNCIWSFKTTKHKILLNLNERFNFPVSILRLYLVYGPNQDTNRVVPITIKNAINIFNCSSGLQSRDFIHIDDLVKAILKVLTNKTNGEILNIASGKPIQIKNLILKICKLVGSGNLSLVKLNLEKTR